MRARSVPGVVTVVAVAAALLFPAAAQPDPEQTMRAVAVASDECGELLPKAGGGTWECTFVDEFEGRELDRDKWLVGETSWSGFTTGSTCMVDSPRNVAVRSGTLRLTARDEGREFYCQQGEGGFTTRYTGGHLATRGRFAQTYGRFEARLRFPNVRTEGVHGGFWLYPEEHVHGPWPRSGEIDVAEWWSALPHHVLPSLHYPGRSFFFDSGWDCVVADPTAYHSYAVEWSSHEMRFFIDGTECFRRSWQPTDGLRAPEPFDHPFNAVFNFGVGPTVGTNVVSAITRLPATLQVDYVRVWR